MEYFTEVKSTFYLFVRISNSVLLTTTKLFSLFTGKLCDNLAFFTEVKSTIYLVGRISKSIFLTTTKLFSLFTGKLSISKTTQDVSGNVIYECWHIVFKWRVVHWRNVTNVWRMSSWVSKCRWSGEPHQHLPQPGTVGVLIQDAGILNHLNTGLFQYSNGTSSIYRHSSVKTYNFQ